MIIVDASVAFKWIKSSQEAYIDEAYKLLELHLNEEQKIVVPSLLFVEVANALTAKSKASVKAIKIDLNELFSLNLRTQPVSQQDILKASLLAKKRQTSVYDMLYAVIAGENKTVLYTADENFIKKTKFSFVKHISQVDIPHSTAHRS